MKRAAIYTRTSTDSKSLYGEKLAYDQRPELQEEPLRRLADQRGWRVVETYTDSVSGAKQSRPALDRLWADAGRGKFDVVMVWRFDRLSRSALHFLQVVEELRSLGRNEARETARDEIGTATRSAPCCFRPRPDRATSGTGHRASRNRA
jgi:DNA invertase Pin-like site-specific DNA recombinase